MLSSNRNGLINAFKKKIVRILRIRPDSPSLLLNIKNIETGMRAVLKKKVIVCFVISEFNFPVMVILYYLLAAYSREKESARFTREMTIAQIYDR